jgi:selenocysteine lyase/cysteine desulfurase
MNLGEIRRLFPVTEHYAYLNHAAVAALPQPVVETMSRYIVERSHNGSEALLDFEERLESLRRLCARFVGAHRDEITFTGSVSHGLNIVAAGLDWQPGDNVICAETEFPANIYPWTNLERRGVEVRFVPACDYCILVEDVAARMDSRTRLVAISFVEFSTGYRNNLEALVQLCHEQGALLSVDGIQGLGALQLDVGQTPVDFLATQSAKWMLGPIGAGFLYVRRELMPQLDPVMTGWRAVVDRDNYYRFDSPLRASAERFEPGSLNSVGLLGMGAAIEFLLSVGIGAIEARILALTDRLIDGLQQAGCSITTPLGDRQRRSGIVCFHHPAVDSATLARQLLEAGVIISVRGDVIRVSPHFYNTETELERLLEALPAH